MYLGNSYLPDVQITQYIIQNGYFNPINALWHLNYWGSIFVLCIMAHIAGNHKGFKDKFCKFFFAVSVLIAIYGLIIYATGNKSILWFNKDSYVKELTATFVNRNSYATFAGCGFLVGLYYAHSDYVKFIKNYSGNYKIKIAGLIDYISSIRIAYILCSFIIFVALVLTNSRAGISLTLGFSVMFFLLASSQKNMTKKMIFFMIAIVLFCLFAPLVLQNFLNRSLHIHESSMLRTQVYRIMIDIIKDYPWFGVGLGGFEYVFQMYRDSRLEIYGYWDKGHCTPLEVILDIGIPLSTMLFSVYAYIFYFIIKAYIRFKDNFLVLCCCICGLCITHSVVDFSLQIPAINILFHIMLILGYTKAKQRTKRSFYVL
jgi:O-antigen ligase